MRRAIFWVLLMCGISSVRADVILDFESLSDSTAVTTQFAGMVFSNATVGTAGVSIDEFDFPPHSGTNVILDDGGPMAISFVSSVDGFGAYFTYLEPLILEAFDASHNLLGTVHSAFSNNTGTEGDAN